MVVCIYKYVYMIHAVYHTTLKGRVRYFYFWNKHVSDIRVSRGYPVHTAFHRVCSLETNQVFGSKLRSNW